MLIEVIKFKSPSEASVAQPSSIGRVFCLYLYYILFIFLINIPLNSFSQTPPSGDVGIFTPNLQKIYTEICQFKIQSAKQALAKESNQNEIKILLDDFSDMILLLNNGTQAEFDKIASKESERLELVEDLDKKSPYNKFVQAEIKLHWTLLKYRFGHEVKAAWNFIQAYRLLEENQKEFPKFIPQYKTLGAVHFILGSIPDSYAWVTKILGLKGNSKQGLKELHIASKDPIWGLESQFYEYFFQGFFLKMDEKSHQNLLNFLEKYKDYLSVNFLATAISFKDQRSEQANLILQKIPIGNGYLMMPIIDYYKGEVALQKGVYENAILNYSKYLKNYKGNSFLKEVNLKIFYAFWFNNDFEKGLPYLKRIKSVGNELADADKFAQKVYDTYEKNKFLPNKSLQKARFAFDGGYFEKAVNEIEAVDEKSMPLPKEKAEYFYRKGRIYHKINHSDKARTAYNQAIKLSENQEWGYGALSTLQFGYLYKEAGNKVEAKKYFERALAYKKHESKNSVDSKAKAALNEL
jgi:tetratricopeptide (TPR) repeat protein